MDWILLGMIGVLGIIILMAIAVTICSHRLLGTIRRKSNEIDGLIADQLEKYKKQSGEEVKK